MKLKPLVFFIFELDQSFTVEKIDKVKAYYENYFTVSTMETNAGLYVTIKLVEDTDIAKRVMQRFFSSLEVRKIDVMGSEVEVLAFIEKFVM